MAGTPTMPTSIHPYFRYLNHSAEPNTGGELSTYALRDLVEGEEMTEDYNTYETRDFVIRLNKEYGAWMDYIKESQE